MNLRSARPGKSEKITASSTAIGLTVSKLKTAPESFIGSAQAFITPEDTIRFTIDGTTPVAATKIGHIWAPGSPLIIEGEANMLAFRMVRESATTDTTVFVTYF